MTASLIWETSDVPDDPPSACDWSPEQFYHNSFAIQTPMGKKTVSEAATVKCNTDASPFNDMWIGYDGDFQDCMYYCLYETPSGFSCQSLDFTASTGACCLYPGNQYTPSQLVVTADAMTENENYHATRLQNCEGPEPVAIAKTIAADPITTTVDCSFDLMEGKADKAASCLTSDSVNSGVYYTVDRCNEACYQSNLCTFFTIEGDDKTKFGTEPSCCLWAGSPDKCTLEAPENDDAARFTSYNPTKAYCSGKTDPKFKRTSNSRLAISPGTLPGATLENYAKLSSVGKRMSLEYGRVRTAPHFGEFATNLE
jgi:hypothetical protein